MMKKNYSAPSLQVIMVDSSLALLAGSASVTTQSGKKNTTNDYISGYDSDEGWKPSDDPD